MTNKAFWRALNSLAHPLTILAAVTLLLNDHWLRWELPSWWTGKLGDFAWLLFAPFLCALLLAWLIPQRWRQQERFVGMGSIAFIGTWFALAKTVPIVHALTVTTLDSIVGWQGGLRMDATDLLTLPALLLSWHIWRNARNTPPRVPLGYVVTALGLMGTLATSCLEVPPNFGVVRLCREDGMLFAIAGNGATNFYTTYDKGLNWERMENASEDLRNYCLDDLSNPSSVTGTFGPYEITIGNGVYRSNTQILDLSIYQHDSYRMVRYPTRSWGPCGSTNCSPGPLDALYDEQSGNLLLAMGHDGILLIEDNHWQWVTIGDYGPLHVDELALSLALLRPEFVLAFGLLILSAATLSLTKDELHCAYSTALTVGWGIWILMVFANRTGFGDLILDILGPPLLLICVGLAVWFLLPILFQKRSYGANIMLIVLTLGVVMIFLLPYALWVRRTVPNHGTASLFALLLVGGAMFTAVPYFRWRFPPRKKKKLPDADDEPLPPPIEHVDTYIVEDDAE